MAYLGKIAVVLAITFGLSIPHTISYVAPPLEIIKIESTIEEKILKELPPVFLKIAKAESGMNPRAYNNEAHRGCTGSYGLLQIACIHFDGKPTFDVDENIRLAKKIYREQGLKAWGVCTNGSIKCHE